MRVAGGTASRINGMQSHGFKNLIGLECSILQKSTKIATH